MLTMLVEGWVVRKYLRRPNSDQLRYLIAKIAEMDASDGGDFHDTQFQIVREMKRRGDDREFGLTEMDIVEEVRRGFWRVPGSLDVKPLERRQGGLHKLMGES